MNVGGIPAGSTPLWLKAEPSLQGHRAHNSAERAGVHVGAAAKACEKKTYEKKPCENDVQEDDQSGAVIVATSS